MHGLEEAGARQMRQTAGIIVVRLMRGEQLQGLIGLPAPDADNWQSKLVQTMVQHRRHSASLEYDPLTAGCDLHTSQSANKIVPHQSRASVSLQKIRIDLVSRARASASSRVTICSLSRLRTIPSSCSTHISTPPDLAISTARSRRLRSLRTASFLYDSKPLIEIICFKRSNKHLDQLGQFRCFSRRYLADRDRGCDRSHRARRIGGRL